MIAVKWMSRSFESIFALFVALACTSAYGADQSIALRQTEDFRAICKNLSPIAIEWERIRQSALGDQLLPELKIPATTRAFLLPETGEYRLQHGMIRCRVVEWETILNGDDTFHEVRQDSITFAYNGERFYMWSGERTKNNMLQIDFAAKSMLRAPDGRAIPAEFTRYFGICLPSRRSEIVDGCQPYLDRVAKSNDRRVQHQVQGDELITEVLNESAVEERFVAKVESPTEIREYSRLTPKGELIVRAIPSNYEMIPEGTVKWPRQCRVDWYQHDGSRFRRLEEGPLFVEMYTFSIRDRKQVPKETFTISDDRPGVTISDSTLAGADKLPRGRVQYTVPADIKTLDAVIAGAKNGVTIVPTSSSRSAILMPLIVANVGVVIALFVVLFMRRKTHS